MTELFRLFPVFLLIFARVTSFFVMMPLFSYRTIPLVFKVGMGFFLALVMVPVVESPVLEIDWIFLLLIIKEVLVGLLLGFFGYLAMSAIQTAGAFIDFQMGFAIANVIDPQTGTQSPLIGHYLYIMGLVFLLAVDGHHLLLDGIYYSYQFIPLVKLSLPFSDASLAEFIVKSFCMTFVIAFQMAFPIVGSIFLVDVALGIIARTVPQFNVFVVGLPVKIAASFIVLFAVMAVILNVVSLLIEWMVDSLRDLMVLMGRG